MSSNLAPSKSHGFYGQRQAWQQFVEELEPTIELMLEMGLQASSDRLRRDIEHFFNVIQRDALGPRWTKKPARDRITAVGFYEHMDSNMHVHLAVRAGSRVEDRLATEGLSTWKSIRPAGDFHIAPIRSLERYSRYITKEAYGLRTLEAAYVYNPKFVKC